MMLPKLVVELLDFYKWRNQMVLMNREYSETCKAILFADGRFDKLSVRRGSKC